jgi:DHA1 family bicyclomycin/chloramphenicol resistance-like MFS transporter
MFRFAVILGLLSTVGPLAIDMYLPALPLIEKGLGADVSAVQASLIVYFIAFGVAQLFFGPYSDQVGRKKPLFIGLIIFAIGSIACALAPTIGWLLAGRFVQGLGGAVVMVVPRAIIRDQYTGTQATRLMALIMMVISVSPMLAPLVGSAIMEVASWRGVFWALAILTVSSLSLTLFALPETLAEDNKVPVNVASLMRGCGILLRDKKFMGLTFIGGFGMASFFVFLANASFVYTAEFGLTPVQFSLAFAVNALGFFSSSQLAATLGEKFGMEKVVATATTGFLVFTVLLLGLILAGFGTLPVIIGVLFLANACLGLVVPSTMVMALDDHGDMAGLASSLGGTLQMVAGGLMVVIASPFFDNTALPMVAAIALCAVLAFILTRLVLNKADIAMTPAE